MKKRGNGEGSIFYSEKLKRYCGQVSLGLNKDGKTIRKSVYAKTRKECNEKMQKLLQLTDKTVKSDITLQELIDRAIENEFERNLIKASSYSRKKEALKSMNDLDFIYYNLKNVTIADINRDILKLKDYSDSTIRKCVELLKLGYREAIRLDIVNYSPFNEKGLILTPRSNKDTKKVEALTLDEEKRLLDYLYSSEETYKNVIIIADKTGMRIGEILALKKDDIDFKNKLIKVSRTITKDENGRAILGQDTKTENGLRVVPLTDEVYNILINLDEEDLLFHKKKGGVIEPSTINSRFKRICKNLKIEHPVNTHMLRHTFATRCIESGIDPVVLSKILGHSKISITLDTYTSVFNQFKNDEFEKYKSYVALKLH